LCQIATTGALIEINAPVACRNRRRRRGIRLASRRRIL